MYNKVRKKGNGTLESDKTQTKIDKDLMNVTPTVHFKKVVAVMMEGLKSGGPNAHQKNMTGNDQSLLISLEPSQMISQTPSFGLMRWLSVTIISLHENVFRVGDAYAFPCKHLTRGRPTKNHTRNYISLPNSTKL